MNRCLRVAILATTTLAGLATVPTKGADGSLERAKPLVQMTGAERWRLRPTQGAVVPGTTGSLRPRTAAAIPEERRHVRQVYPALVEAR